MAERRERGGEEGVRFGSLAHKEARGWWENWRAINRAFNPTARVSERRGSRCVALCASRSRVVCLLCSAMDIAWSLVNRMTLARWLCLRQPVERLGCMLARPPPFERWDA